MKATTIMAALAGVALFAFSSPVFAQGYKPTGDDGITASPRLRQQLDDWHRNHSPAPTPAEIPQMACPKCTDKVTSRIDYSARGANKPVIRVVTHQCEGCGTDWKIVGVGKGKQSVATHKCSSCGAENLACCNTTKGSTVATKGMEKKNLKDLNFEVAPVK
ncbi:MAG: hypothetical protein ABS95_02895 [Verrucomicrobia bacterium SCN 57-15]|nr:MAG: hypothetical protein ABS95_02895 [Verrucomicrobia bacterium SCN 57-15]